MTAAAAMSALTPGLASALAANSATTSTGDVTPEPSPELSRKIERLDWFLAEIASRHGVIKLASSLAAEDMVLTHAILSRHLKIAIFSLNTGRLHPETVAMVDRVNERYGYQIEQFYPLSSAVDAYVATHGINAFYENIELRKQCCEIRKVEPLNRALSGADAWVTGQRREQSVTRAELLLEQRDTARGIAK
jgi:phosphoadenosine phosphosulfate reductase